MAISVPDASHTFSKIMALEQMLPGCDCRGRVCLADNLGSRPRGGTKRYGEKKKSRHMFIQLLIGLAEST